MKQIPLTKEEIAALPQGRIRRKVMTLQEFKAGLASGSIANEYGYACKVIAPPQIIRKQKRLSRYDTIIWNDQERTIVEWAAIQGLRVQTMMDRIKTWPLDRVMQPNEYPKRCVK